MEVKIGLCGGGSAKFGRRVQGTSRFKASRFRFFSNFLNFFKYFSEASPAKAEVSLATI